MASPPAIPSRVESYDAIPKRLRPVYSVSAGDGYELSVPGRLLAGYRTAITRNPDREPIAPLRTLTKAEWMTLVGVAEPGPERQHFLRAVAQRRLKVEG